MFEKSFLIETAVTVLKERKFTNLSASLQRVVQSSPLEFIVNGSRSTLTVSSALAEVIKGSKVKVVGAKEAIKKIEKSDSKKVDVKKVEPLVEIKTPEVIEEPSKKLTEEKTIVKKEVK